MIDYNVLVDCGEILVKLGDLIFTDLDGVLVIPAEVLPDTIRLVTERTRGENHSRAELLAGAYLRDAYEKHGVL